MADVENLIQDSFKRSWSVFKDDMVLFIVVGLGIYSASFRGPFLADDLHYIPQNPYVTDPSAGRLLEVLRDLQELDNSVLVVEHDLDVIRQADWMVELGPESGVGGGHLVFNGAPSIKRISWRRTRSVLLLFPLKLMRLI